MRKSAQVKPAAKGKSIQSAPTPDKVLEAKTGELITKTEQKALQTLTALSPAFAANIGKGRPRGSKNKVTRSVREMMLKCYDNIGGDKAFAAWADKNRTEFYRAFARLVPRDPKPDDQAPGIHIHITPKDAAL